MVRLRPAPFHPREAVGIDLFVRPLAFSDVETVKYLLFEPVIVFVKTGYDDRFSVRRVPCVRKKVLFLVKSLILLIVTDDKLTLLL